MSTTMRTTRRRLRAATAALAIPLLLVSVTGLAACADRADGSGNDGVASLDEDGTTTTNADDSDDSSGGERPANNAEMQDAMLEYTECMRDQGIDMPDPDFNEDGGVTIKGPQEDGSGPDSEKFDAADEECRPILEEAMPERDFSPEELAEMQDHLVEVAECMRGKGYDMADPEVDDQGRVKIGVRGGENGGGHGGRTGKPGDDDQFKADMDECGGNERGPGTGPGDGGPSTNTNGGGSGGEA